jgi:hypothetical protein
MLLNRYISGFFALTSTLALGACSLSQDNAGQQAKPAPLSIHASVAGKALTADQVNVQLSLQSEPVLTANGQSIAVTVNLVNSGKTILSSSGAMPVHLGAHSVDANGKVIDNDLARVSLPDIAPGTAASVTIQLPLTGTVNKSVQILPVQEGVAWFDTWGTKPLTVGPFSKCSNSADGNVCAASGKPLTISSAH